MQRIGFDLLYLVPQETGGMETYARELIPRVIEARPDLRYTAFVNRESRESFASEPWATNVKVVRVPIQARNRVKLVVAEQALLPRKSRQEGIDVLHSLGTLAPMRIKAASVVTIHDVIYKHHPDAHRGLFSLGMRVLVPLAARSADRVIAASKTAAEDLVETTGIDRSKVDVIHYGVGAVDREKAVSEDELRRRLGLGSAPIVLTVSAKRRHKNLVRLIEAFSRLETNNAPILVMPGYPTPHEQELKACATKLGVAGRIKLFGWLDGSELEGLYEAASCFVFPSLLEGFGLPVLEAMSRGLPVACSNAGPLPEVAGNAALFFDPHDTRAIANSIDHLLRDESDRGRLAAAGQKRAEHFSWERAARRTVDVYERAYREHAVR